MMKMYIVGILSVSLNLVATDPARLQPVHHHQRQNAMIVVFEEGEGGAAEPMSRSRRRPVIDSADDRYDAAAATIRYEEALQLGTAHIDDQTDDVESVLSR